MENGDAEAKPWQSYHTVYTNAKAGMDGVDKEKVQKIVYEMSKGSKYFEHEERKEALMKQKIENMRALCSKLTPSDLLRYQTVAEQKIVELEAMRDLTRIWLHVDMDAFYAAVETLSNLSLQGKPMAVGGLSMICTANYEARKFGVRAAMPGFIARKLCPELIFVPTDFKKYTHYSDLTRKVFQDYDPKFIAASLDEAYLDITETCKVRGISGAEIADELRSRIYEETGLTCSAGVAANRLLAKVCSDINKPNGQFVLPNDRMAVMTFISSLPIRKIGGIGKVTEHILKDVFGISTCEQMLQKGGYLCALFSQSSADFFLSVGLGLGSVHTPETRMRKSISNERTFSATENKDLLYNKLAELAETLSADMQKEGIHGRTLTLKLKTASFEVRSRAVTMPKYISSAEEILNHASKLLKAELPVSVRLMGLRMSHFMEDELASPSGHRQKTIHSYLLAENMATKSSVSGGESGHDLIHSNDNEYPHDKRCSVSQDLRATETKDFPDQINSSISHCVQISETQGSLINNTCQVNDYDSSDPYQNSCYNEVPRQLAKSYSITQSTSSNLNNSGNVDNETSFAIKMEEGISWVDDYKCSLCGFELPSNFAEERQEHSDFHFAEWLQHEDSQSATPIQIPHTRQCSKNQTTSNHPKSKKRKLSTKEGKHLPIDKFFVKNNKNL
ncbi:unnamed protein product [Rhodiola kirilowii]